MFNLETTVKLHHTDAAGVLFFGNYFHLAHDMYEQYMTEIGLDFRYVINEAPFLILIVHAEANYHKPMYVSERLQVAVAATKIGRTSFDLTYRLRNGDGTLTSTMCTTQVVVDKESGRPIPIPRQLTRKLREISEPAADTTAEPES